ncbi:MAG TPA: hypothetical protein ACFCUD_09040 [Cyclobacteriaceae bacterium]
MEEQDKNQPKEKANENASQTSEESKNKLRESLEEFLGEFRENVMEGAKEVGKISAEVFQKVKEDVSDYYESKIKHTNIYKTSNESFEKVSQNIKNAIDKFKGNWQMKQLSNERDQFAKEFGMAVYHEYMKNESVHKQFLTTKKISKMIEEIHDREEKILETANKLSEEEKAES